MAQLNINSLRYKFDPLKCLVKDKIDLLVVTETKLDESFPSTQFSIDSSVNLSDLIGPPRGEAGIIIFIREYISHKVLEKISSGTDDESIFMEITLRNSKWLLIACYNPEKSRIYKYIQNVETTLNKLIKKYDNIVMLGDLNIDMKPGCENELTSFCNIYNKNLIDKPTCYKNPSNPTYIDVILTNRKNTFSNTNVTETGLSDYHKMTITCLKCYFQELPPKRFIIGITSYLTVLPSAIS